MPFWLSDSMPSNIDVDCQLIESQKLPFIYGRWLTMLTVWTLLKQVQFIQQTLTTMSQAL